MNLNKLKQVTSFDDSFITIEQRIQSEYLASKGFETYIEGPYGCSHTGKEYCYIWAVKEGARNGVKRINSLGYDSYVKGL